MQRIQARGEEIEREPEWQPSSHLSYPSWLEGARMIENQASLLGEGKLMPTRKD
jgi:hypothetical protein